MLATTRASELNGTNTMTRCAQFSENHNSQILSQYWKRCKMTAFASIQTKSSSYDEQNETAVLQKTVMQPTLLLLVKCLCL